MMRAVLWLLVGAVLLVKADGAASSARVLFVGDSITANTSVPPALTYPALIGRRLPTVLIQNLGRPSGSMSTIGAFTGFSAHPDLLRTISGFFPATAVVVLLGTNDWKASISLDTFARDFGYWRRNVPPSVAIVCVTPPWRRDEGANDNGDTLDDFRAVIATVCAKDTVVDGTAAIPHDDRYFVDGLHPNGIGNRYLARAVQAAIEPLVH